MPDFSSLPPEPMLLWIVALPLLGAVINGLFGRYADQRVVSLVAVMTVGVSFLLALYCFVSLLTAGHGADAQRIVWDGWTWFHVSAGAREVPVHVRFVMDHLSAVMAVMVTGISALIHVYSTEYMGADPGYPRFMAYLNLFTASMLILVLASGLPLMFVGWEGVGLCSYLLIGFWWENPAYAAAGRKAFVVNRIGDFGVLIGAFLLLAYCQTFEFAEINERVGLLSAQLELPRLSPIGVTVATAAALFLFLGCAGKSAQIPLYVWLPDAMAGPTPVSALIHAATMVTAGVYLCCRLSPVFMASSSAMATIAVIGALTALLAASIGVAQTQMKRILAYSTVSQLGFMFAAVGCGAFAAGFFHVFTHAFFKACLFLGAGSVMHAVHAHGDADIRHLGGMRKYMPLTHGTFAIACLAIAGIFPLSGFFSKDEILFGALESTQHLGWVGWFVFGVLSLTAALTSFYMFRLYFLTFWGPFRGGHPPGEGSHAGGGGHEEHAEPQESGEAITYPLIALAAGAVLAGLIGMPHWWGDWAWTWWSHWLTGDGGPVAAWPVAEGGHGPDWMGPVAMLVGLAAGIGGIALAWVWYKDRDAVAPEREALVLRIGVGAGALATAGFVGFPLASRIVESTGPTATTATAVVVLAVVSLALALFLTLLGGTSEEEAPVAVRYGATGSAIAAVGFTGYAIVLAASVPAEAFPTAILVVVLQVLTAALTFALFVALSPTADIHAWALAKWKVDELYDRTLVRPFRGLAGFSANFDRIFVDGLLTKLPPLLMRGGGWVLSRLQTGAIYAYTVGFALGAAVLVWWFTYPHTTLEAEVEGARVTWSADRGPGYEYRWDFDSDGAWDTDWSAQHTISHEYGQSDAFYALVAIIEPGVLGRGEPVEVELDESPYWLLGEQNSEDWRRPGAGSEGRVPVPASIRIEGAGVVIDANDARVSVGGRSADAEQNRFELSLGDMARVGDLTVRIAARVRATVEVRNAFGNLTRRGAEVTVRVPHTELERLAAAGAAAGWEASR
jgi:NADH-quinone oxidoreductase subunit L